ncbi:TM2 domain-containing protein [Chryseobacterium binzhouense]|jgi:TM2 domain-containing membrane protein YozV|uniref:TM2 domain-containing protein n=1 Tax=Chryseobacterium binzhouense TaxID=2593646 RepID=UPI00289B53CD|nr:TM2 domain-containing protein [Chryseobacterium binzhouense]
MKSKFTAAMLALFLGGLGIHRFYLGQNKRGIFYLLFCWTFIPSLIACIDFFAFIFMSEDNFNYKYNLRTGF